jgi:integrase
MRSNCARWSSHSVVQQRLTNPSKVFGRIGSSSSDNSATDMANCRRKARGIPPMPSFGFRDLKGKGATDMWLAGVPIEQIQLLCGHTHKATTEVYTKQRGARRRSRIWWRFPYQD